MNSKVKLINSNQSWNAQKRYKINDVVSYSGNKYQNTTGINSDPTLELGDWLSMNSGATNTDSLPEGSTNLYFTTARVLATLLTGISFVTNAAITSADSILTAFGKLQAQITYLFTKIPSDYSKVVYVNATNPATATIFDILNPPTTNDNSLKNDVNNLYVGTDASTWYWNSITSTYATKVVADLFPIYVTGNQTVLESWKNRDVYFTGSGLLTYPNTGLSAGHNFNLAPFTGVTITWAITSPKTWRVMGLTAGVAPPSMVGGQFCLVSDRIGTNEIMVSGI